MIKTCNKCELAKSVDEFYKSGEYKGKTYYSSSCRECTKERRKEYRKEHPEKVRETKRRSESKKPEYYRNKRREYYEEHRDKILVKQKEYKSYRKDEKREYDIRYREEHSKEISENKKRYYRDNPGLFRYHRRKRKYRERGSEHLLTKNDEEDILVKFHYSCPFTGSQDVHMDHFIPVATGFGETSKRNLILLDSKLNLSKGSKNPFIWAEEDSRVDKDIFNEVVRYLAKENDMTEEEYEEYVYECFK